MAHHIKSMFENGERLPWRPMLFRGACWRAAVWRDVTELSKELRRAAARILVLSVKA
ncbi:MAG: hypothetical protein HZA59_15035 [Hydrogenophilales bacterium]|nr:hypothetical protein [Hydrogenophilales bacterium]